MPSHQGNLANEFGRYMYDGNGNWVWEPTLLPRHEIYAQIIRSQEAVREFMRKHYTYA